MTPGRQNRLLQTVLGGRAGPVRPCVTAGEAPMSDSSGSTQRPAMRSLRFLIVASVVTMAGCAAPGRPLPPSPPAAASKTDWQQVDRDLSAASLDARKSAGNYARGQMEKWRSLAQQRTEADFIPWFTDYWTQKWLSVKLAWYKLNAEEGTDPSGKLAAYLQGQFRSRVLAPVMKEVDPDVVREQATTRYVQSLGQSLEDVRRRHAVADDPFDRRIKDIPAIAVVPHNASLYQVVHADPLDRLPAYVALITQIRGDAGGGTGLSDASVSSVAKAASQRLESDLATSGGAGAAATLVGGALGAMISMGAVSLGAVAHENERPKMERKLREDLSPALDEMGRKLMDDPATGVMAGVYHISAKVAGNLAEPPTQPL